LIHGLVQAELVKGLDFGAFRAGPRTLEDALVRNAALEALTRHVGRRIAARANVQKAYVQFTRGPIRRADPAEVDNGHFHRVYVGTVGEDFLRDAADRYVAPLIDRHGWTGAAKRVFERPPTTIGTLLDPDGRTILTPRVEVGETVRACLADEAICDPVQPMFRPQLEALLLFADPEKRRAALEAWVTGFGLAAETPTKFGSRSAYVRLIVATDPAGAEAILDARVESVRSLDGRWERSASAPSPLASVRSSVLPQGLLFERVIDGGDNFWDRPRQLLFREDDVVVEINIADPASVDTDAPSLARRVRAALRSVGGAPPTPDAIGSDSPTERWRAVRMLGRRDSLGWDGRQMLEAAAEDADLDVRRAAFLALARRGILSYALRNRAGKDASWELRWLSVVDRTRDTTWSEEDRAKRLLPLLADPDPRVRVRACRRAEALVYFGKAIPWTRLRTLLSDKDDGVRATAFGCLTEFRMPSAVRGGAVAPDAFPIEDVADDEGPPLEVAAAILAGLADPAGEVRCRAAGVLEGLGPLSPDVEGAFCRALADRLPSVRQAALDSLADLEPPLPDLVEIVAPFLDDEDEGIRVGAIRALIRFEPLPDDLSARILGFMDDEDEWVRSTAADALGELGVASDEVVAALRRGLKDKGKHVRDDCRDALRELGIESPVPKRR
jgi:HEAT repeat protein